MTQREEDRQQVLAAVHSWIEQGMGNGGVHVELARGYGQKYGINEQTIQDWLIDSRREFDRVEYAREWAQTLP
jgi:hypothetical protein